MSAIIGENIKENGYFICSGILESKEQDVKEALVNNKFRIIETNRMNDWIYCSQITSPTHDKNYNQSWAYIFEYRFISICLV